MGCDREREEMNDDDGGRNLGRGQFLRAILDAPGVLSTRYLRHVLTHHGGRNGFNLVKSILADRPESPMHQPHERDDGRGFFAEELAGEYMNPTQAADVVLRFTSRTRMPCFHTCSATTSSSSRRACHPLPYGWP